MISYIAVYNAGEHQTIYYQPVAAVLGHSNVAERSPTSLCSAHPRQYRVLYKLHTVNTVESWE